MIMKAAANCRNRRRAVVLGSGSLIDIPVEDLSAMFDEVALIDILHLPRSWRKVQRFKNVSMTAHDITGVVSAVYAYVESGGGQALPAPPAASLLINGADLAVSACVASQLYHLPLEYLAKALPAYSRADAEIFAGDVVARHMEALAAHPGAVCLITEIERMIIDGDKVANREDPLYGIPVPFAGWEWTWDIAPPPEFHPRYGQKLKIMGAVKPEKG
ncbi:MAG: hypothetical protein A3G18_10955 [Rhodospirillales bacterium RIFCSPLOWO2_12_FULL_58_28]|nr:MAG: hypothetical protein A3H92_03615 [Rhodospirillales bacterium RIFCSPLOWO2_02_FULL_58_16]OHC77724.1 MAG: hypothetical protein A3G18_10955 [Rhodospirillales bacterium RIFCSPLOWO2_12_FULL_58_28]